MNRKQKTCLLVSIVTIVVMGLYPPWVLEAETTGSTHDHWEHGVYCVGADRYRYEWMNADKYVHGSNRREFLEKIGLEAIANMKLRIMTSDHFKTSGYAGYVFDTAFLNYLGKQGWELVDVNDRGTGAIVNRIYWLKRPKI